MVGMDDYLSKPFRRAQLFEIIARHVGTGLAGAPERDSTSDVGLLDWKAALATVDGDRNLLCAVLHAFLTQYPSLVTELREGLEGRDAPTLQRAAHTLGGSLRMFDGADVVEKASAVEERCQDAVVGEIEEATRALMEELDVVVPKLQRFVAMARDE